MDVSKMVLFTVDICTEHLFAELFSPLQFLGIFILHKANIWDAAYGTVVFYEFYMHCVV